MAVPSLGDILTAMQNAVRALTSLSSSVGKLSSNGAVVLPQGALSGSAGAPTGTYLVFTAPDGNQYKIQLLSLS